MLGYFAVAGSVFLFALFKTIHLPAQPSAGRPSRMALCPGGGYSTDTELARRRRKRISARRRPRRHHGRWNEDRNFQSVTEYLGGTPAHDWCITAAYLVLMSAMLCFVSASRA